MKYTSHFSNVIRAEGAPHLNQHQLQRFMNIVFLESSIKTLEELEMNSQRIFMKINKRKDRLSHITKSLSPKELLMEMVRLSTGN